MPDLDVEIRESLKKRTDCAIYPQLKNNRIGKEVKQLSVTAKKCTDGALHSQLNNNTTRKDVNQFVLLTGTPSTLNETDGHCEQSTEINLQDIRAEDTDQMKLYEQLYKFISFLGFIFGYRFKYDWKPSRYAFYWFHAFTLLSGWFTIGYTVHIHYVNGSYVRILEPISLTGITVSVKQKLSN